MKKFLALSLLFAIVMAVHGQIQYNNRSFLKEVSLWSKEGKLEVLPSSNSQLQGKFFSIRENGVLKGLAYVGRVNSCRANGCSVSSSPKSNFEYFDYYAILDPSCTVQKIKVFNYQATHGQEITAKSWLKQFIGYNGSTRLDVGKNVDAIAGATTSTNSLTSNVQDMVRQLKRMNTH